MTNAIDNARKALETYRKDGTDYHLTDGEHARSLARAVRDLLDSLEYEYAQGFEEDEEGTWYIGKSFGHESNRPLDEGYVLLRRGLLPWEGVS